MIAMTASSQEHLRVLIYHDAAITISKASSIGSVAIVNYAASFSRGDLSRAGFEA
jgi:hypothetical protein